MDLEVDLLSVVHGDKLTLLDARGVSKSGSSVVYCGLDDSPCAEAGFDEVANADLIVLVRTVSVTGERLYDVEIDPFAAVNVVEYTASTTVVLWHVV